MSTDSTELKSSRASFLRDPKPWNWIEALLIGFLALIGMDVILAILISAIDAVLRTSGLHGYGLVQALESQSVVASFIFYGTSRALGFLLIYWFVKKRRAGLKTLGFEKFKVVPAIGRLIVASTALIIISGVVFYVAQKLTPSVNLDQAQNIVFTQAHGQMEIVLSFIALVIIAPIVEETVFRGFLLPAMARRFGVVGGVLVTSILFGVVHGQLNVGIITFVMGLLLAWLYAKSRSIIPGIMFHSLKNLVAFILIFH